MLAKKVICKRVFDLAIVVSAGIVLLPVVMIVALLVKCKLGSPVLFKQMRPGLYGEPFNMLKFRTMRDAEDENGNLLADADRLTSFGAGLRSTSLDELPGLWNILRGQMSVVGPRPLLMEYLPLYNTEQARRHDVRPGLTGLAQISGRNALSWEERFKLDVWYVENQSFWLDIKILARTVQKVWLRENINAAGEATMSKFKGDNR